MSSNTNIRKMTKQDKQAVIEMMRVFYTSPAVFSNGSENIFLQDIEACTGENPYLDGYIFAAPDSGEIQGYGMVAKSFSTEFGKPCAWIEDIYIKDSYRGLGIGSRFIEHVKKTYAGCVIRLEVEEENERAVKERISRIALHGNDNQRIEKFVKEVLTAVDNVIQINKIIRGKKFLTKSFP